MEIQIAKTDEKARICVSKEVVKTYGDKFIIVRAPKEIVLLPVPKEPIKELQVLGRKAGIYKIPIQKIKEIIAGEALKEVKKRGRK